MVKMRLIVDFDVDEIAWAVAHDLKSVKDVRSHVAIRVDTVLEEHFGYDGLAVVGDIAVSEVPGQ